MKLGDRLSINHYSVRQLTLEQLVEECRQLGISYVGLWREKVHELGIERAKALIAQAELKISSLIVEPVSSPMTTRCNGRSRSRKIGKRSTEAAVLGTELVVLVCGGIAAAGLTASREMVAEGIAQSCAMRCQRGVSASGIEPLHPIFAADRSVIVTFHKQTNLAAHFAGRGHRNRGLMRIMSGGTPALEREIGRAAGRIFGFHVSDWIALLPGYPEWARSDG